MSSTKNHFPKIPSYDLDFAKYLELNRCQWTVEPAASVLLIYDMQTWYVNRYEDPSRLVGNIKRIKSAADAVGVPTVYAEADPVHNLAERGIARDLWGDGIGAVKDAQADDNQIYGDLTPSSSDFLIRKRKYSAFFETDLESLLRRMNRSQIILCGNYANHGCMTTAVDAYMRNFKVFFMADALGAFDAAAHDMALRWVADTSGQVTLTEQVIAEMGAVK